MSADSLSAQLRSEHSELMTLRIESIALELFEARGFSNVTVEDIAAAAHTSVRTFYRYFPAKQDVLQVRVTQRGRALRQALDARPAEEAPLRSLRIALASVFAAEGADLVQRWIAVVAGSSDLVRGVLGSVQLNIQGVIAAFLAQRLAEPPDALQPTMMAAAVGGVVQASLYRWFGSDTDLAATIEEGLAVLEKFGAGEPA